jgi:signal transduction histidine kinase
VLELGRAPFWRADERRARWIGIGFSSIPLATAAGVALQRHVVTDPSVDTLLVAVLLMPCALNYLTWWKPGTLQVPPMVWTVLVPVCVLGLVVRPVASDLAPFFLVIATAEAAVEGPRLRRVVALVLSIGVMVGVDAAGRFEGAYIWVLGIALAWVSGTAVRMAIELLDELQAAQADLAARAAADERQRIAREVHDVVAHSLAVMMLHVTGARMNVRRDPDEAVAALEQAELLGRQSLGEVRRIVGLLQPEGSGTASALPTAAELPALVERFHDAGLDVVMTVDGDLARITASSGLALYRIAQESLTNVSKHAPGVQALVHVDVSNGTVHLAVTNEWSASPPAASTRGSGLGVPGMRDRAAALGGALSAGATEDGRGWRVDAELPTTTA